MSLEHYKKIIYNFIALAFSQGINHIMTLAVLPFIVPVLGNENIGQIFLAQTTITYISILCDFGFNSRAIPQLIQNKNDINQRNKIVSRIFYLRFLLFVLGSLVLFITLEFIGLSFSTKILYYVSIFLVLGQILSPSWYFQVMGGLTTYTFITASCKIVFFGLIYVYTNQKNDSVIYPLFNSLGYLIGGIGTLFFLFLKFNFRFMKISYEEMKKEFMEGLSIFYSHILINIISTSNIYILKIVSDSDATVGIYAIAERIIVFTRNIISVVYLSIYPRACEIALEGHSKLVSYYRSLLPILAGSLMLFGFVLVFFSDFIIHFIQKSENITASLLLSVMAFYPLSIILDLPVCQVYLIYNKAKIYSFNLLIICLISIFSSSLLTYFFSSLGTALNLTLIQVFSTIFYVIIWDKLEVNKKIAPIFSVKINL